MYGSIMIDSLRCSDITSSKRRKRKHMNPTDKNLTQGPIYPVLIKLALPIMGTSFLQMAYNLTDLLWIGRIGSQAVASVGTAGFYLWLGFAFILMTKVGAEVKVAQNVGAGKRERAVQYARNAIGMNFVLALVYGALLFAWSGSLIGFFNIQDAVVVDGGIIYLKIIAFGILPMFFINVMTGIFNGYGDSKTPFLITAIGLVFNMILDPVLIFGLGPFPEMGIEGAALATILSMGIVALIFLFYIGIKHLPFPLLHLVGRLNMEYCARILKLGLPVALHSAAFTIFSMLIARIIANWGPIPIAVQKVGSQIEAISWMTASGFSTALGTFTGQNYGAKDWQRIWKGYMAAMSIMGSIGILTTLLLILGARPIFSVFIPEAMALEIGTTYLRILGLSQFFMCIEITTAGAFNGLGKTLPPSLTSILLTGARVPAAVLLSNEALLGLNGIWWSISMSSVLKGTVLVGLFMVFLLRHPQVDNQELIGVFKTKFRRANG